MLQETIATITARSERMDSSLLGTIDRRLDRFEARIYDVERRAGSMQAEVKKCQAEAHEKGKSRRSEQR